MNKLIDKLTEVLTDVKSEKERLKKLKEAKGKYQLVL